MHRKQKKKKKRKNAMHIIKDILTLSHNKGQSPTLNTFSFKFLPLSLVFALHVH